MLFFYDVITRRWPPGGWSRHSLATGVCVGLIGVVIMLTPWQFQSGIMFDTRSVLLSVCGLFFGAIPTLIAMLITTAWRIYIGGSGMLVGVMIILSAGCIGIVWRSRFRARALQMISPRELFLFGVVVHVVMLSVTLLLPWEVTAQVVAQLALPVLIVFPVVTVGLGVLFSSRIKQQLLDSALLKSEERMRSLYSHAPVALWEEDWSAIKRAVDALPADGVGDVVGYLHANADEAWRIAAQARVQDMNDAAVALVGAKRKEELIGCLMPFFNASRVQDFIDVLAAFTGGVTEHRCESPFVRLDGELRWFEVRHAVMPGHETTLSSILVTTLDITERKVAEEALQVSSSVYQNSSEAMSVTDAAGVIIDVNPAFTEVTGYARAEVLGQTHNILSSGHNAPSFYRSMWQKIKQTGRWKGEIWNRRKSGEVYAEWLTVSTICDANGAPYRRIALFSDITQEKQSEELLWQHTHFDPLTGLPNRLMFLDRLEQELKKAQHSDQACALLLIGLDRFKAINDSLGYAIGDGLIQRVADRLRGCVHDADTIARIGGDEFAVILSERSDVNEIEQTAQRILARLAEPFQCVEKQSYLSGSIGVAFYPGDAQDADSLIQSADQAMCVAKSEGRNRRNYCTPAMQASVQDKIFLMHELRTALSEQQFEVYYQPIVDLGNQQIYKAEALIRWRHPVRGFISPVDFIPIAEESGLIIELGSWVFQQAVTQVKSWRQRVHPSFQISINKSPVQFRSEGNALYDWFDLLHAQSLPGNAVVVEITEGLMMDSGAMVSGKLFALSDAGIEVALDDFGTGYSSLSYLKKFDIDYLKIDQSFVRNLEHDADNVALCESMIAMAHKLGIKVIAEGVETRQQCDLLTAWGCDYAQGYLFAKPLPAAELESLMIERQMATVDD